MGDILWLKQLERPSTCFPSYQPESLKTIAVFVKRSTKQTTPISRATMASLGRALTAARPAQW
jgi:hypothetical protein